MFENNVLGYEEVQRVISDYNKSPSEVLKRFGIA